MRRISAGYFEFDDDRYENLEIEATIGGGFDEEPLDESDPIMKENPNYYNRIDNTVGFKLTFNQKKNPSMEYLLQIKEDYDSGVSRKREEAMLRMAGVLDGYIHELLNTNYKTYMPKYKDDLEMAAFEGIIKGLKSYNPEKGKPTTWFDRYIRHEITNFINCEHNTTPYYEQQARIINKEIEKWESQGITPSVTDISIATGISGKTIIKVQQIKTANNSLPFESGSEETTSLRANIPTPEEAIIDKEQSEFLEDLIYGKKRKDGTREGSVLTEEQRMCILYAFGFMTGTPEGISSIARYTNLPKQNIKKYIDSALTKLETPIKKNHAYRKAAYKPQHHKIGIRIISKPAMDDMEDDLESSF